MAKPSVLCETSAEESLAPSTSLYRLHRLTGSPHTRGRYMYPRFTVCPGRPDQHAQLCPAEHATTLRGSPAALARGDAVP